MKAIFMNDDEIKKILKSFLVKDNYTVDQYLEMDEYLNIDCFVDHLSNKTLKIELKNNLNDEQLKECLNKFFNFRLVNTVRPHVEKELETFWKKYTYDAEVFTEEFQDFITIDPLYKIGLEWETLEFELKNNILKKVIKIRDDLTIVEYLHFQLYLKSLYRDYEYCIIVYDRKSNKFDGIFFKKFELNKFESKSKLAWDSNIFFASYKKSDDSWIYNYNFLSWI